MVGALGREIGLLHRHSFHQGDLCLPDRDAK